MMDEEPLDGENVELAMAMYRYARVFLDYLDAAETLLDLEGSLPAVEPARDLVANGRDVFGGYDEVSAAMERVLNPRRSADKLMEGLEYAAGRFDVDLELARADESRTWEALVDAVGSVPRNESWENEDGWIWYRGGMDGQRDLLTGDEKSADRIRYYRRRCSITRSTCRRRMRSRWTIGSSSGSSWIRFRSRSDGFDDDVYEGA